MQIRLTGLLITMRLGFSARKAWACPLQSNTVHATFKPTRAKQQGCFAKAHSIGWDCWLEILQVYGLKRLVRGLASGRQGARQGYALALSKLLGDIPALSITEVLATMASELDVSRQAKVSFKLHHSKRRAFPERVSTVLMRQAQLQAWQQWGIVKTIIGCCRNLAGF